MNDGIHVEDAARLFGLLQGSLEFDPAARWSAEHCHAGLTSGEETQKMIRESLFLLK